MWKVYALLAALFAALTAIFAKIGLKNVNSDLATAIRTVVILVIVWGVAFFKGETRHTNRFAPVKTYGSDTNKCPSAG